MNKQGGMERVERDGVGVVLRPGSRFRVPQLSTVDALCGAGPAALPFRVRKATEERGQRTMGLPPLRVKVEAGPRSQAYRVIGPSTTRIRMRGGPRQASEPSPRFRLAGRGGPRVVLSDEDEQD